MSAKNWRVATKIFKRYPCSSFQIDILVVIPILIYRSVDEYERGAAGFYVSSCACFDCSLGCIL